jgi:hypothetical protein
MASFEHTHSSGGKLKVLFKIPWLYADDPPGMYYQISTEVYLRKGALHTQKSDQVVEVNGPLRKGLQVHIVLAC